MAKWDPAQYERYKTYRDRPALDLLVQIPQDLEPDEIWDLGCGTGSMPRCWRGVIRAPRSTASTPAPTCWWTPGPALRR